MRTLALSKWLQRHRTRNVPHPRRTVLGINPFEERWVPAALTGSVYQDLNNNGVRDCMESGIAGVKVHLFGKTSCGQIVCQDTVTDCQGNYKFDNLAAGDYAVVEQQPAGFMDGKDTPGSAGGVAVCGDAIVCVHLNNCTNATGYNFGEVPACSNQSHGQGSDGKGSGGKGSHDKCDSRQSNGKGSGGKGSSGKGSHDRCSTGSNGKGSGGKGSHDRCMTGSNGKGTGNKGSNGKGSHDMCGGKVKGNNGVGNGLDPQPPGNPRVNDGLGTSPGNPGNRGGK